MLFRFSAAAIAVFLIVGGSAQAQVQVRSPLKFPDPRGEFVRQCAPHMVGRWAHPESVCGCLHDYAAATVEDSDLREALLRGISETGVPDDRDRMGAAVEAIRDRPRPSPRSPNRRCNACSNRPSPRKQSMLDTQIPLLNR